MADTKWEESSGRGGYAFGPFVVDPLQRRLWRESRLLPITSKTFDLLVVLLEHRDHVVTKDELLNRVWPNTVVNENNLARQISSLRRALGQRPDEHDYVVTIPGHGYRFVASVRDIPEVPAELQAARGVPSPPISETLIDAEDPPAGYDPVADQPIPEVHSTDSHPGWPPRPKAQWESFGTLIAASCGVLAAAAAIGLWLRPADRHPEPRRTLQRITYDKQPCLGRAPGRPTGSGWYTRTTAREMPTFGNNASEILTRFA